MLRQFSARRILGAFVLDWLGTLAVLLVAAYTRAGIEGLPQPVLAFLRDLELPLTLLGWEGIGRNTTLSFPVLILVTLIWPFFFVVFSVYDGRRSDTIQAELLNVFLAVTASTLTLAGALYLTFRDTSRALFLIFFLLDMTVLLGARVMWWIYRRFRRRQRRAGAHRVLIVGSGSVGKQVALELNKYATRNIDVIGFVDDDIQKQQGPLVRFPVLGTLDQLDHVVREYDVRDAVIALPLEAHRRLIETCHKLQELGVRVHVVPDLFDLSFPGATLDGFAGIPVVDLGSPGITGWRRQTKRLFDVVATSLALLLLSPLFACIAILIKLDSHGTVLYKQERIGENGRPFTMFKFRSMKVDSDSSIHKAHVTRLIMENLTPEQVDGNSGSLKIKSDPRITRVGRIIRKTSLDELPQLINVLRGDMSLVGPRPPLPYEVEVYQDWHKRRLEAPPGITGPWQIMARNKVSFDEMVRMDLDYIERQSLFLDIRLLLQTPWALFKGHGAG